MLHTKIAAPQDYLDSYEAFSRLHKKAIFAQKSLFLEGAYTKAQQAVLATFAKLQNTPEDFEENVRTVRAAHPTKDLEELISKVMLCRPRLISGGEGDPFSMGSLSQSSGEPQFISSESDPLIPVSNSLESEEDLDIDCDIEEGPSEVSYDMRSLPSSLSESPGETHGEWGAFPTLPPPLSGQEKSALFSASLSRIQWEDTERKGESSLVQNPIERLKNPECFNRCIEKAVLLKYVFPEIFRKMFPGEEERQTVQIILHVYGLTRLNSRMLYRAVDEAFAKVPKCLGDVVESLEAQEIPSIGKKGGGLAAFPPLPRYFINHPSLIGDQLEDKIHYIGQFRYQFLGIYSALPPAFRNYMNAFCGALFIRDAVGWPIEECLRVSFAGKFPNEKELDALLAEIGANPSEKEEPSGAPLTDEILSYPYLKYPVLFDRLYAQILTPALKRNASWFVVTQIKAMQTLKEQCLFKHEEALERCFNRNAIKKLCGCASESAAVKRTLEQLRSLTPPSHFSGYLVNSPEEFEELLQKSEEDLRVGFQEAKAMIAENPGMEPMDAIRAVFDPERLAALFGRESEYENGQAFEKAIRELTRSKGITGQLGSPSGPTDH